MAPVSGVKIVEGNCASSPWRFLLDSKMTYVTLVGYGISMHLLAVTYAHLFDNPQFDARSAYGYFGRAWLWFPFVLPAALWILRYSFRVIDPTIVARGPGVLTDGDERERANAACFSQNVSAWLYDRGTLVVAAGTAVVIVAIDTWQIVWCVASYTFGYSSFQPTQPDWSVSFYVDNRVPLIANLGFDALVYVQEWLVAFTAILVMLLMLRHNVTFLKCIYQRRRAPPLEKAGAHPNLIVLNFLDHERCFGLLSISRGVFNLQLVILTLATALAYTSRVGNVSLSVDQIEVDKLLDAKKLIPFVSLLDGANASTLFPTIGQVLIVVIWVAFFVCVALPGLVKMLPGFSYILGPKGRRDYLKEFLPDGSWQKQGYWDDTLEQNPGLDNAAKLFRESDFWPSGKSHGILFFWAAFSAMTALIAPRHIDSISGFAIYAAILAYCGLVTTTVFWVVLSAYLFAIDRSLASLNPFGSGKDDADA